MSKSFYSYGCEKLATVENNQLALHVGNSVRLIPDDTAVSFAWWILKAIEGHDRIEETEQIIRGLIKDLDKANNRAASLAKVAAVYNKLDCIRWETGKQPEGLHKAWSDFKKALLEFE